MDKLCYSPHKKGTLHTLGTDSHMDNCTSHFALSIERGINWMGSCTDSIEAIIHLPVASGSRKKMYIKILLSRMCRHLLIHYILWSESRSEFLGRDKLWSQKSLQAYLRFCFHPSTNYSVSVPQGPK
jgi:hypothetical protein